MDHASLSPRVSRLITSLGDATAALTYPIKSVQTDASKPWLGSTEITQTITVPATGKDYSIIERQGSTIIADQDYQISIAASDLGSLVPQVGWGITATGRGAGVVTRVSPLPSIGTPILYKLQVRPHE